MTKFAWPEMIHVATPIYFKNLSYFIEFIGLDKSCMARNDSCLERNARFGWLVSEDVLQGPCTVMLLDFL